MFISGENFFLPSIFIYFSLFDRKLCDAAELTVCEFYELWTLWILPVLPLKPSTEWHIQFIIHKTYWEREIVFFIHSFIHSIIGLRSGWRENGVLEKPQKKISVMVYWLFLLHFWIIFFLFSPNFLIFHSFLLITLKFRIFSLFSSFLFKFCVFHRWATLNLHFPRFLIFSFS